LSARTLRAWRWGFEAHVTILDVSLPRLNELDLQFGAMLNTIYSTIDSIEESVVSADLVIGGVLLPGAAAPKLITEKMVKQMKKGSVIVDVAIDQGGCAETSHATTHDAPTYLVHDVVHYCVANMPGGVARTSTFPRSTTRPLAVHARARRVRARTGNEEKSASACRSQRLQEHAHLQGRRRSAESTLPQRRGRVGGVAGMVFASKCCLIALPHRTNRFTMRQ